MEGRVKKEKRWEEEKEGNVRGERRKVEGE